jgi:hypothetical protein
MLHLKALDNCFQIEDISLAAIGGQICMFMSLSSYKSLGKKDVVTTFCYKNSGVYSNFQSDHWNIVKVTITFNNYVTNVVMLLGNNPCIICSVGAVTSFLRKDRNRI